MHDDVYQMYLEEIRLIPACTPQEEQTLPGRAQAGDQSARKRLLEDAALCGGIDQKVQK